MVGTGLFLVVTWIAVTVVGRDVVVVVGNVVLWWVLALDGLIVVIVEWVLALACVGWLGVVGASVVFVTAAVVVLVSFVGCFGHINSGAQQMFTSPMHNGMFHLWVSWYRQCGSHVP